MKEMTIDLQNYKKDGSIFHRTAVRGVISRKNTSGQIELLMIHGKYGDYKFPGGGQEQNETNIDTLCREVKEETGFSVKKNSEKEFCYVLERRKGNPDDIMEMENFYYQCETTGLQGDQNLDQYEKDYQYKTIWITPKEAVAKNKSISNFDNIPWIKRETLVLSYIISDSNK
ncbi:MAG: NUDIX domain-containing protein [Treponema sp.]|nr:NUDIX domain-containing protein [Treponema sp.]